MTGNAVDPLPLSVSLEKVDEYRFKAIAPAGAPFALELPLSVSGGGEIEGAADSITIPAGAAESVSLGATKIAAESDSATVDIGALPALPGNHLGYVLEKDATLPVEIKLSELAPPLPQVTGVVLTAGIDLLEVSWTAVAEAHGYKVQWKSAGAEYEEARQAMIEGGDTVSHTITELTAGTVYTVRVIATKENVDDGPPSEDVTGTPGATPPGQVAGLVVMEDAEQLTLSWTEVADADGYTVQWKSGVEEYDEARQAVIAGGDTVSHTITGLTAGTEYAVRIIATRAHAEDGPPSEAVTATPQPPPLDQVTGVEIRSRMNELHVSWTAVEDADGYKVQWKSGEEVYDESRQAEITDGDTESDTITGLTAGTEYTVRVIATRENVDDGPPSGEVSATPRSGDPDVNGDGVLDRNDALIMLYAYSYASLVGDGESGGTADSRQRFLAGYSGRTDPSDEVLKEMLRKANAWREAGVNEGGDINEDGMIDGADARVMYYAYAFAGVLGNGETGGTARFRSQLLGPFAGKADPTDEDLKAMLRRANQLREDFSQ